MGSRGSSKAATLREEESSVGNEGAESCGGESNSSEAEGARSLAIGDVASRRKDPYEGVEVQTGVDRTVDCNGGRGPLE